MPRTVLVRSLDDATYAALSVMAARAGVSVSELLRGEAERIARRPSQTDWVPDPGGRALRSVPADSVGILDELRGGGSPVLAHELG